MPERLRHDFYEGAAPFLKGRGATTRFGELSQCSVPFFLGHWYFAELRGRDRPVDPVAKLMPANFTAASDALHQFSPKVEAFSSRGVVEEDASISRQSSSTSGNSRDGEQATSPFRPQGRYCVSGDPLWLLAHLRGVPQTSALARSLVPWSSGSA